MSRRKLEAPCEWDRFLVYLPEEVLKAMGWLEEVELFVEQEARGRHRAEKVKMTKLPLFDEVKA